MTSGYNKFVKGKKNDKKYSREKTKPLKAKRSWFAFVNVLIRALCLLNRMNDRTVLCIQIYVIKRAHPLNSWSLHSFSFQFHRNETIFQLFNINPQFHFPTRDIENRCSSIYCKKYRLCFSFVSLSKRRKEKKDENEHRYHHPHVTYEGRRKVFYLSFACFLHQLHVVCNRKLADFICFCPRQRTFESMQI